MPSIGSSEAKVASFIFIPAVFAASLMLADDGRVGVAAVGEVRGEKVLAFGLALIDVRGRADGCA